jgi:hypothetical protein
VKEKTEKSGENIIAACYSKSDKEIERNVN